MADMSPTHAREPRSGGWKALRILVIVVGVALSPLFFADMFANVRHLLLPGMGDRSWIVPAATEGSFLFLFLLDVLLLLARKPAAWLRYAPFLFAAMSLALNIWGGHGSVLLSIGYGAVTLAFFVPIVAGEQAIRSMSVTDEDVRQGEEMKAAMRHASDLVRSHTGWRRWRAPSLLRIQIRHRRPPASVASAIRDGANFGGAAKWEELVEAWVSKGLMRNAHLAARLEAEKHAIEAAASTPARSPEDTSQSEPEIVLQDEREARPGPRPQARPEPASVPALKLAASKSRSMSPGELEPHVSAMLQAYGSVSQARVKRDLHVSTDKAAEALRLAKQKRTVVQFAQRQA
jgi:hypothetical protein